MAELSDVYKPAWHAKFKVLFKTGTFEKVVVLIMGISIMQPLHITVAGAAFSVRRFGLGPESIGAFLGITYSFQQLFCLMGSLTSTILSLTLGEKYQQYWIYINGTYSMVLCVFITMLNTRLLLLCATSIGDSNLTAYYWTLAFSGYLFGALDTPVRQITVGLGLYFALGQAFNGFCVNFVHAVVPKFISPTSDVHYWTIYWQILFVTLLSMVAGILWTIFVIFDKFGPPKPNYGCRRGKGPDFVNALQSGMINIFLVCGSLGTQFCVYPSIAPFSIVTPDKAQNVIRACLYLNALVGVAGVLLKEYCNLGKAWDAKNSNAFYNASPFLFVPYFFLFWLFIYVMHHPKSFIGSMIYMKPNVVFILTVAYFLIGGLLKTAGFGGAFANMNFGKPGDGKGAGQAMAFLGTSVMVTLVTTKFIASGYLRAVRAAKRGLDSGLPWPTEDMSEVRAFFYWLKLGIIGAGKTLRDVFTTDIRTKILV
ncbi:hypothetical protein, conserved [Babesia bigemina]|uniref:Uncharacterized protein n=1 Tax=Babesia bigemina TaxID=5866 RepID=A0A061D3U4_BABBI|nr:hypothetical protein, conserved [Babesia bigemina]CDR95243.1 hypothetical protein, conserved [Babesia bigemina]|eukprot:XP_012767429.1 hypothetical protein, conserved [Babesia bigemina]